MSDPLSAAVEAVVQRAIVAQLPAIIDAIKIEIAVAAAPAPSDRFIPIAKAADLLGMTPSTVWRLERTGKLPAREKIGGRVGYRQSTIDAILAGASTEPLRVPTKAIRKGEKRGGRKAGGTPVGAPTA